MPPETQIIIADDHPIFRQGLRQVIEAQPGLKVVAEAGDGEMALERIRELKPEIAILDLDMPKLDGFGLVQILQREKLPVRVIILTIHSEEDLVNQAMDLGVLGYVLKESAIADIVTSVRAVKSGQHYLSPAITSYLVSRGRRADSFIESQPQLQNLTPAEQRVLKLIAEYKTSKDIAEELFISHRTVENHRTNICQKLDLHGSHALLKFALRHKSELS